MDASSSSYSPQIKRYHVFLSFHGSDVRRKFLSHLHYHFESKGITAFKDQEIERGHTIGPELKQAIRESRISIVVLSKNYASSRWCLDELVEIMKRKEDYSQTVMPIFYDVNPSDLRKERGAFGRVFKKTCAGKTKKVKQRWSKALTDVANEVGVHSLSWIIITTNDKKFLGSHKIEDTYHVDFPSKEEALEILCLSAFSQNSPLEGFEELAYKESRRVIVQEWGLQVEATEIKNGFKVESSRMFL